MRPDHRSESSGAGGAVIVALILLVVAGCAVVAGVWFFRVSAIRQRALMEQDIAMAREQEALARERAARRMAEQAVETAELAELAESTSDKATLMTIKIDEAGGVQLDDKPLSLADLETSLRAVRSEASSDVQLLIRVHDRCAAAHLLDVVLVCSELGMDDFKLTRLDDESAAEANK